MGYSNTSMPLHPIPYLTFKIEYMLFSDINLLIYYWRELAAESIYRERCTAVEDGSSWATYMSISGSPDDEYDIISLQYTEEGLLTVDENREGHAAAFGDDIAIECLATEFKREIYVVRLYYFFSKYVEMLEGPYNLQYSLNIYVFFVWWLYANFGISYTACKSYASSFWIINMYCYYLKGKNLGKFSYFHFYFIL